jgi:hypothetical protein
VAAKCLTGEEIATDAIGGESDTSGATSSGSASTWRCTADGAFSTEVGVRVAGAVTSAGDDATGRGPGSTVVSNPR